MAMFFCSNFALQIHGLIRFIEQEGFFAHGSCMSAPPVFEPKMVYNGWCPRLLKL